MVMKKDLSEERRERSERRRRKREMRIARMEAKRERTRYVNLSVGMREIRRQRELQRMEDEQEGVDVWTRAMRDFDARANGFNFATFHRYYDFDG